MRNRLIISGLAIVLGVLLVTGRRAGAEDGKKADQPARKPAKQRLYVVVHGHGPKWDKDKPVNRQPGIQDHARYMVKLFDAGKLKHGGPFLDGTGGMAVFLAPDDAAAQKVVADDPAIKSGIMKSTMLRPWHPVDWKSFPRK